MISAPHWNACEPRFLIKFTAALKPLTIVSLMAVIFSVTAVFTLFQILETVFFIAFMTVLTVFLMPFQMLDTVEEIALSTDDTNPLIAFHTADTTA